MPIISDPSYKACNPQVAIRVEVAIPVPKPASRRLRFNSQPASCDSSPKSLQPTQVAIHFEVVIPVQPASRRLRFNSQPALRKVAIQFATCKLRFHAQNLHPAGCELSRNLRVAIPVPKACNPQVAIQVEVVIPVPKPASCRLRFNSQPALRKVAIQFATCKLRFQSQNLHPAGCDLIRNLQVAIPVPKACNLQVAIHFEVVIPFPKPASRRLQFNFNSQPASCDCRSFPIPPIKPATHRLRFESKLRFQSQNLHPAGCDSNPYHLLYLAGSWY